MLNSTEEQGNSIIKEPKTRVAWLISIVLLLSGLLIAVYLFYHYLKIADGAKNADVCSAVFGKGCDTALQSSFSSQLGLPLAAWGIIYYCTIFLFLIIPSFFGKSFKTAANLVIYLLTLSGLITALVLLAVMIINPSLFCPFCTIIHIINLAVFFLLNHTTQFSAGKILPAVREGAGAVFSNKIKQPETQWKIVGFACTVFLCLSMYFGLHILTLTSEQESALIDSKPILAEYKLQAVRNIPVTADDPVTGTANSLIRVVVFSDFFCPSCRRFSSELTRIINKGEGKYNVVFKYFPLSTDCNSSIEKNLHPGACEAAAAAVAAQQQGKFWAFHDSLFTIVPGSYNDLPRLIAEKTGLNIPFFEEYRHSEMAKAKVIRDIVLAKELGIDATPTVFLNGRLVKDMRPGILQFLINQELKTKSDSINAVH